MLPLHPTFSAAPHFLQHSLFLFTVPSLNPRFPPVPPILFLLPRQLPSPQYTTFLSAPPFHLHPLSSSSPSSSLHSFLPSQHPCPQHFVPLCSPLTLPIPPLNPHFPSSLPPALSLPPTPSTPIFPTPTQLCPAVTLFVVAVQHHTVLLVGNVALLGPTGCNGSPQTPMNSTWGAPVWGCWHTTTLPPWLYPPMPCCLGALWLHMFPEVLQEKGRCDGVQEEGIPGDPRHHPPQLTHCSAAACTPRSHQLPPCRPTPAMPPPQAAPPHHPQNRQTAGGRGQRHRQP